MNRPLITLVFIIASAPLWALDVPNPTNPSDGITNAYTRQLFYWATVSGAGSYELQVDTTLAFNSPLLVERTFTSNSQQFVYHFHYNTHYYWRMRSVSKTDAEVKSDWCAVRQFTTLSQVDWVSPNNPEGSSWYYPQQDFTWKNSYGSTKYVIEIDTTKAFNSPVIRRETYTNSYSNTTKELSKNIGELYMKCTTYWRVKAYNENDSSDWSTVAQFNMIRRAVAQSPDSLQNAETVQSLKWKYQTGLTNVIIELDTTNRFDSPIKQTIKSSGSSQSYCYQPVNQLLFGQDYYWRVKSYHQKDTTEWSKPLYFHTYRHCNLTKNPQDSATEVITSPQLNFNYTSGISNYQMQLDTTPLFNSPLLQDHIESASSQTYAYHVYSDLLFGTTYYRRVRECLPKDTSDWSPVRCFTTIVRGAYSTSGSYSSIANGATGIAIRPQLYYFFRNYIDSVEIQLDTTKQFNSPLFQSIRAEEASSQQYAWEYPKRDLLYGTTYYWRIRNSHSKDVSEWTFPRYFTTIGLSPAPTLVSPEDKSIIFCDDSTQFSWNPYSQATNYTLQLSDKSSFDSIWNQVSTNDTLAKVKLRKDITYYWRVSAATDLGNSKWSSTRILSTKDSSSLYTLEAPVLTWPDSVVINAYTRQEFKWNAVEGAGRYVLQIDTSKTFATPTINDTLTERDVMRYHFRYGTTHYWRVRALSATSAMELSRWSQVRRFTTVKAPTLSSPNDSDPEGYYNPKQNFRWKNSCGSNKYVIEIDTCPGFDSPARKRVTESTYASNDDETLSTEVGNLYLGKMTYWRVKAYNNNDSSEWSKPYQFHTLNWAACSSPADSAQNQYTTRYLYWKRIEGLPYVIIELDTTAGFDSDMKRTITSWAYYDDDAKAQVTQLLFGTKYYWRVRYYHTCDTTVWSPVRTFSTYDFCKLSSPADNALNRLTTGYVYWEWSTGVSYYQVQIDTNKAFTKPVVNTIEWDLENSDHGYQYKELNFGTTYYWRVRECHAKDTSAWSVVWAFTTTYQMAQPTLTTPTNQTVVKNGELVTFNWNSIDGAISYIFQLSDDGQFNTCLHQETVTGTTTSMVLPDNSILYWRIQAIDTKGRSPWSNVWGINTGGTPTSLNVNENVNANQARKIVINGHLYIIRDDKRYDATGFTID